MKPDVRKSAKLYDSWHERMDEAERTGDAALRSWHMSALQSLPQLDRASVLEVGCGRGDLSIELASRFPTARITGLDLSAEAVGIATRRRGAEGRPAFVAGNAESLPFAASSFDCVVSCECLEHVPSPAMMAREIFRVLRPGGMFVITTENYFNGMLLAWAAALLSGRPFNSGAGVQPIDHFFVFWRVRRLLSNAGLAVTRMDSHHYQWLLLPRVDPARLCTQDVANPMLKRLFRPFGRHFTFVGRKPRQLPDGSDGR